MRFLVGVFVAWTVLAAGVMAQQLAWEPVGGPYGGRVVEFEEPERGRLLARTHQGWHELHDDRWLRLDWPLALGAIAVGDDEWLASGTNGLYQSADGQSWQHVGWKEQKVKDVAVSADHGWFVVVGDTIYRSSNEGETWSAVKDGIRYDEPAWPSERTGGLATGPDGAVYLTRFKWSDFYSTTLLLRYDVDSTRWDWVASPKGRLRSFATGPEGWLFVGTEPWTMYDRTGTLMRSADGTAWESIGDEGLAVASGPADTVYVGRSDGLYVSGDHGSTWERASERDIAVTALAVQEGSVLAALGPYSAPAIDPHHSSTPSFGVYRFDGERWTFLSDGLAAPMVDYIEVLADDELLVTAENGTWHSNNGVGAWRRLDDPLAEDDYARPPGGWGVSDLELAPEGDLYATFNWTGTLRRLRRDSVAWEDVWSSNDRDAQLWAVVAPGADVVLAAGDFGVVRSTDGGETWEAIAALEGREVTALLAHENSVYAATAEGGLYHAGGGGSTWEQARAFSGSIAKKGVFVGSEDVLYVAAGDTLYRSLDSGTRWTPVRGSVGGYDRVWVTRAGVLVATRNGQVYRAPDAGGAFVPVGESAPGRLMTVAVSPEGIIYEGTRDGLWRADARRVAIDEGEATYAATALGQPYPNPSSGGVRVPFVLERRALVRLGVYDLLGRCVAVLVDHHMAPGGHEIEWTAPGVAAGVYVVRLVADGQVETQRIVVVR